MTERPTNWRTIRKEELEDAKYRCRNCKRKGGEYGEVDLEVHHTVPLSQNGNSNIDNLRALCKGCHKAPHSKDAMAPNHVSERGRRDNMSEKELRNYVLEKGEGEPEIPELEPFNSTQYAFWGIVSLGGWLTTYVIMSAIGNEALFYFVLLFSIPVWFILPVGIMMELGRGE